MSFAFVSCEDKLLEEFSHQMGGLVDHEVGGLFLDRVVGLHVEFVLATTVLHATSSTSFLHDAAFLLELG